jgi:hypothetical protein
MDSCLSSTYWVQGIFFQTGLEVNSVILKGGGHNVMAWRLDWFVLDGFAAWVSFLWKVCQLMVVSHDD